MLSTYASYQMISRDIGKSIERVQSRPMVQRESEYYLENITKVKTIDDFVGDYRLFNYAMKAFGLSDMAYAKAFMVKAMEEGISAADSFANRLADKRYKEFVDTFNFERHGELTTVFDKAQQGVVDKYVRLTLEEEAGNQNEGVRLALYFERKAATIGSAYDILADRALSEVVRTALGLPETLAAADIDKQAALISERIDIEDFKDPEELKKFVSRFAAMWEVKNAPNQQLSSIAALIAQPVEFGMSTDTLMAIAKLKR